MKFLSFIKFSFIILIIINLSSLKYKNQANNGINKQNTISIYNKKAKTNPINIDGVGNPYITNFNLNSDKQILSITQDDEKVMVFASNNGILLFDGLNWQEISIKTQALKIKYLLYKKVIIIGGNNDYGYLKKDKNGKYKYHSLSKQKINIGEISEIKVNNEYIFFYSEKALVQLRKSDFSHKNYWHTTKNDKFKGIIKLGNKIFISKQKGLFEIKNKGKLKIIENTNEISKQNIIFDIYYRKNKALIGTENNKLFLFNGKEFILYKTNAQKYIEENGITGAINISYNSFSLITRSGGAIIINKEKKTIIQAINNNTGLPDDKIFAIYKDKQENLWVSTRNNISRVNYNFPIKDFNSYPAISGNLIDIDLFNNTLYVATTKGLYYLDTVSKIKLIDKYIKGKSKQKKGKAYKQSLNYMFKKVKSLNKTCSQILKNKNNLVIATSNGVYEVKSNKAKVILKKKLINQIYKSKIEDVFYAVTDKKILSFKKKKNKWKINEKSQPKSLRNKIYSVVEDENFNLWVGGKNVVYKYIMDKNQKVLSFKEYKINNDIADKIIVKKIKNKIYFVSSNKIFEFNTKFNKVIINNNLLKDSSLFSNSILKQKKISWFKQNNIWNYYSDRFSIEPHQISLLCLFDNIKNIKLDIERNLWVIDGNNKLYKILPEKGNIGFIKNFKVFFKEIHNEKGNLLSLNNANLEYEHSALTFKINAPFYLKTNGIKYQYYVKGIMKGWTDWRNTHELEFLAGSPGIYKLNVRAKNIFGNISPSNEVVFSIKSPFWMKTWFIAAIITSVFILSILIIILLLQNKKNKIIKEKSKLEKRISEKISMISNQKEEIAIKNNEISENINYAWQIQKAIIPPINILKDTVKEHFIINKPKNIVSGDYYWICRKNDFLIVAVADCTGHGVQGALLSMLGISLLKEIANKTINFRANHILEELRYKIISTLNHSGVETKRKDGIDISLCIFNLENKNAQYAGAYSPLYLIRNNNLVIFKADRMPIGIHAKSNQGFTNTEFTLKEGDTYYMFSDGYVDQFGGDNNRKFLSSNFQNLLLQIQNFDLQTQKEFLTTTFDNWKGDKEQLDDVLILGFKY